MTDPIAIPEPKFGDVIPLFGDVDIETLPDVRVPYYVIAREGIFAHVRPLYGHGFVKTERQPTKLAPLNNELGHFWFTGQPIPKELIAQAYSFFKRAYENHKSEAAVYITQHHTTGEYRLYVPIQRVSGGGVHSIYDPTTIARGWMVVGTIHSHCNFNAYHSSTDEADARGKDGMHFTIGQLMSDSPTIASMLSAQGVLFHYPPSTLADISNINADTAPAWWDRYLWTHRVQDSERPAWCGDEDWNRFMGRTPQKYTSPSSGRQPTPIHTQRPLDDDDDYLERWGLTRLADGTLVNAHAGRRGKKSKRKDSYPKVNWAKDGSLLPGGPHMAPVDYDWDGDYWEDKLGREFVDSILDSNLFTEDDLEQAIWDYPKSSEEPYWEAKFRAKLFHAVTWLRAQGLTIEIKVSDSRIKQLPGQTTINDFIHGGQ